MNPSQIAIALWTLVAKEVRRFTRIWPQTLVPPSITMTMYFIIFGNLIGSRVGEMHGISYMSYIVPGLIMMSVITNSYSNVASSFFSNKFQRSVEEMMVSPMNNTPMTLHMNAATAESTRVNKETRIWPLVLARRKSRTTPTATCRRQCGKTTISHRENDVWNYYHSSMIY